jgi:glycosyltransferase XagB
VQPELLRQVDARFNATGADVVQGGVQLMNLQTSWWSLRNCLEYYFWFRSRLHFHANARFIPLGGNTVFARASVLKEVGGWDSEC